MRDLLWTIFVWMPRALWGDVQGHRGHDVRMIPGPYGFCETCKNVVTWNDRHYNETRDLWAHDLDAYINGGRKKR